MSTLRQSGSNKLILIDQQLTVDTGGAYTAGDALSAKVELQNAVEQAQGGGLIRAVYVADLAKQGADIDFLFFDDTLTSTPAANTALDLADADLAKFIGMVQVGTDSLLADNSVSAAVPAQPVPFIAVGTSLWVVPVVRGTPTYVNAADVTLRVLIERR